jgi:hypothetical protein
MRAMYTQKGGVKKTNYFKHADRIWCENMVFQRLQDLDI